MIDTIEDSNMNKRGYKKNKTTSEQNRIPKRILGLRSMEFIRIAE